MGRHLWLTPLLLGGGASAMAFGVLGHRGGPRFSYDEFAALDGSAVSLAKPPDSHPLPAVLHQPRRRARAAALVVSMLFEQRLFWANVIIPAAAALHYRKFGVWLPDPSEETAMAHFRSALGRCSALCNAESIDAVRWAWVIAMAPSIYETVISKGRRLPATV